MAVERAERIQVESLSVSYQTRADRATRALDDVSVSFERGRRVAIVGESGSGKSTLGLALLGLLPDSARVDGGRIDVARDRRVELLAGAAARDPGPQRVDGVPGRQDGARPAAHRGLSDRAAAPLRTG